MPYSDIPTCIEKRAPVAWALELHAGLSLPFHWGPFELPPLAAGTLSLFEMAYVQFLQNPFESSHWDIMRGVYIALEREKAHALCQEDRQFHIEDEREFDLEDVSTWSRLDMEAMKLLDNAKIDPKEKAALFEPDSRLRLWKWLDISFSGYRMVHGGKGAPVLEWLFGLDSLAAHIMLMGMLTNESVFDITWRLPIALGSHMAAQHAAANNPDVKVYREFDHGHIDRIRDYILKTENAGELLYWQKIWPDNPQYDLSDVQIKNGEAKGIVEKFCALIDEVKVMTSAQREARAAEILAKEGID